MNYVWAYLVSILGGFIITGPLVYIMRKTSGIDSGKEGNLYQFSNIYGWSIFWLGATERGIATTLFIFAPPQLPLFIAGWSAAKIAAGWGRHSDIKYAAGHMSALIGTAWSFCIAIGAGYWVYPGALAELVAK